MSEPKKQSGCKQICLLLRKICYEKCPIIKDVVDFIWTGGGEMKKTGWTVFVVCQVLCTIVFLTVYHSIKPLVLDALGMRTFQAETIHMSQTGESAPILATQVLNTDFSNTKIYVYQIAPDQGQADIYVSIPNEGYYPVQAHINSPFWTNSFDGKQFVYSVSGMDFVSSPRWLRIKVSQK